MRQTWPSDRLMWTTMIFASLRIIQKTRSVTGLVKFLSKFFVDTIETPKVEKQQHIRKKS